MSGSRASGLKMVRAHGLGVEVDQGLAQSWALDSRLASSQSFSFFSPNITTGRSPQKGVPQTLPGVLLLSPRWKDPHGAEWGLWVKLGAGGGPGRGGGGGRLSSGQELRGGASARVEGLKMGGGWVVGKGRGGGATPGA